MTKHVPPSRIRYEESHPTVTFRISSQLKAKLDRLQKKTGKSLAHLLKEGLDLITPRIEEAYDRGWYNGMTEFVGMFDVPCSVCGEAMILDGKSDWRVRQRLQNAFKRWHHVSCGSR